MVHLYLKIDPTYVMDVVSALITSLYPIHSGALVSVNDPTFIIVMSIKY